MLLLSAAAGIFLGLWGAAGGPGFIRQWLYFFAWYPYLLFLDGLLLLRQGESWLLDRPREFFRLLSWSVTFWLVFEAFNLVLKNWRYLNLLPQWWLRWPGYGLAFATVLPGILLTSQLLKALGAWQGARGRGRSRTAWQPLFLILGMVCLILPLIQPRYAFPLVWGAFFFLLDPVCDLLGGASLTRRWLAGERREIYCLLTAGLICGLWWEMWNYPAVSKWVYALPILNFGRIFEMPFLGYLGFLPFALEAAVMYNFMRIMEERVLITPKRRRLSWILQIAFWLLMFAAIDARTVISFQ